MNQHTTGSKYEYFIEQAASYREAHERILSQYGERAKVLTQKKTRVGGFLGLFPRDMIEVHGYITKEPLMKRPAPGDFHEEKKKILETVGKKDPVQDTLLKELRELKVAVESQKHYSNGMSHEQPLFKEIQDLLQDNEFSRKFSQDILQRLRRELSVETLQDTEVVHQKVIEWIGDAICIHTLRKPEQPNVFILVGPTGVGKTTTIAKLAAMHRLGIEQGENASPGPKRRKEVRILTIDNYRIGARQQIETYGQIMEIPVSAVESSSDLRKYLDLYSDADVIFIDTIGKSPKDYATLGKMKALLASAGASAEVHLAMSATTKCSDMLEILQQFEPFGYQSVIITKLDETSKVGAIVSSLWEKGKTLSFMTNGQSVPHDIQRAEVVQLLINLEGFKMNRSALEERHSNKKTEQ
ncbi:MAG: flagellar biosynthesis protein FlhF [Spirochaetales bacterium]|nr:flagellar biosynthesis protein FlhF [Spirochaetales bacterium]